MTPRYAGAGGANINSFSQESPGLELSMEAVAPGELSQDRDDQGRWPLKPPPGRDPCVRKFNVRTRPLPLITRRG